MPEYQWRRGGPKPKVGAQVFGEVVERLAANQEMEAVPPRAIVDEARSRRSPIHPLFEWDNNKAGDAYRIVQARHYISSLVITRVEIAEGPAVSTRGFYSVKPEGGERGYATQQRMLSERDYRRQVLIDARRELESFLTKYMRVLILCGGTVERLNEVVDTIRDEIDAMTETTRRRRRPTSDEAGQPEEPAPSST